jgi:hypothetical protein
VVQGRGRTLFPDGLEHPWLRLVASQAMRSGVVASTYAVDSLPR